jgi:hypothetical protein
MTTEVDLTDQDGGIVSIAAVDDTFWANSGAWATGYAASKGMGVFVPGGAPQPGSAERNIAAVGDWQNWLASTSASIGATRASAVAPVVVSQPALNTIGISAIGAVLGGIFLGPLGAGLGAALGAYVGTRNACP